MNLGDELHSFVIKEILGHGGMGGVYVGEHKSTGELVAIKTLFEEFSQDEAYVRRFQREASVYRQLKHPNIVEFISSGFDHDVYFIAMEHILGDSLDKSLKEGRTFPVEDTIVYISNLSSAISHAHSKGIIHRDIKPQNIMIRNDGVIKLLDFGVAQTDDDLVKTATGSIVGTFFYASPEQNQGQKIDERSDLYSIGLVFYEMLTGKRALSGSNPLEIATTQRLGEITRPETLRPDIPEAVSELIMRLLEKDPGQRFQSARDLENNLKRCIGSTTEVTQTGTNKAVNSGDKEFEMQWSRAKEAFGRQDLDKAMELATGLVQKTENRGDVHCFLGKIHAARGFSFNAIAEFKQAITLEPSNHQYCIDFGVALYSLNLIDKSKEEFEKVLELDPDNPFAKQYIQLIAETDLGKNNTIPERSSGKRGSFNLSDSMISSRKDVYSSVDAVHSSPSQRVQTPASVPSPQRVQTPASVPSPQRVQTQGSIPPPKRVQAPASVPPPKRVQAPASVPPPNRVQSPASVPPPNRVQSPASVPPPRAASKNHIPPPERIEDQTARDAVLGREPNLPKVVKSSRKKDNGSTSRNKINKLPSKNQMVTSDEEGGLLPETARFWTYVWWGAGKLYGGSFQGAVFWSFVQLFLLAIVILPLFLLFMPEAGLFTNPKLDFRGLERRVMTIKNVEVRKLLLTVVSPVARSSVNRVLIKYSEKYFHFLMLILGGVLLVWYEVKLPADVYRRILRDNMNGKVIEVRQDLTIKIDIGETKGVKVGLIFAVKKKKHLNKVSGANFKTMVIAPVWFTAGKAKVITTATTFSICKFKRLPGEASSPSIGDAVVVMSREL